MKQEILKIKKKFLSGKPIDREDVNVCQQTFTNEEELYMTYFIMARYYLEKNEENAMTYCILKCWELNEKNHFKLDFKVQDFIGSHSDFIEDAIVKTRKRLLPLSILFGVIILVLVWLIMAKGDFIGFILGFIGMNLISINFQKIGSQKTLAAFKQKQYAAVYPFLEEQDKLFANGH